MVTSSNLPADPALFFRLFFQEAGTPNISCFCLFFLQQVKNRLGFCTLLIFQKQTKWVCMNHEFYLSSRKNKSWHSSNCSAPQPLLPVCPSFSCSMLFLSTSAYINPQAYDALVCFKSRYYKPFWTGAYHLVGLWKMTIRQSYKVSLYVV